MNSLQTLHLWASRSILVPEIQRIAEQVSRNRKVTNTDIPCHSLRLVARVKRETKPAPLSRMTNLFGWNSSMALDCRMKLELICKMNRTTRCLMMTFSTNKTKTISGIGRINISLREQAS